MARIESTKIAGYYPAPESLLPSFASTLSWPELEGRLWSGAYIVDPCAGDGQAVMALRDAWEQPKLSFEVVTCELEERRAAALAQRVRSRHHSFHGDAFRLDWSTDEGATVLWLNPPYDHDPEFGRLEHRFLVRFTNVLHRGAGFLLFLIPGYALAASASFLSREFVDVRCFRLPSPEYEAFKQVLLVARRAAKALPPNETEDRIRHFAEAPGSLPVLEPVCSDPIPVTLAPSYGFAPKLRPIDMLAVRSAYRPWEGTAVGFQDDVKALIGAKMRTVLPPKPSHIALTLAAGHFNGHRLAPNDSRLPAILAKGVFQREFVKVGERTHKNGAADVEVERPKLELSVLDLRTYQYHTIAAGSTPTGSRTIEDWNVADVVVNYDKALANLLKTQFPPLHDPTDPTHQIPLPTLARNPYPAQSEAIQAALKRLTEEGSVPLQGEVGCGKTLMSIYLAAALSPAHHDVTVAELEGRGFHARRLPIVNRTLVVCPPHLLESWDNQIHATIPGARVQVLDEVADLAKEADFYLLSRERAKLGYGIRGVSGRCPRCAARIKASPEEAATGRLRCQALVTLPKDRVAQAAVKLAVALQPVACDDVEVQTCLPRQLKKRKTSGVLRRTMVVEVLGDLLSAATSAKGCNYVILGAIKTIAYVLGCQEQVADYLLSLVPVGKEQSGLAYAAREIKAHATSKEPVSDLLHVLGELRAAGRWEELPPCGEPLFQATKPHRIALAKHILRRAKGRFELLVLDEAQEFSHATSAQTKAAHRLMTLPGVPTLVLSGSFCSGYASSMFSTWWAISRRFREEFRRSDRGDFVRRYGYVKVLNRKDKEKEGAKAYGTQSDRETSCRTVIGEAPGVAPAFIIKHLLPTAIVIHKTDMEQDLPPMSETPVALPVEEPMDRELVDEYKRVEGILMGRIRTDLRAPSGAASSSAPSWSSGATSIAARPSSVPSSSGTRRRWAERRSRGGARSPRRGSPRRSGSPSRTCSKQLPRASGAPSSSRTPSPVSPRG